MNKNIAKTHIENNEVDKTMELKPVCSCKCQVEEPSEEHPYTEVVSKIVSLCQIPARNVKFAVKYTIYMYELISENINKIFSLQYLANIEAA